MNKIQQRLIILLVAVIVIIGGVWMWLGNQQQETSAKTPQRVIATTTAQTQVFAKLGVDLVGVPTPGSTQTLPKQYRNLPKVGNHVAPNLEMIAKLKPDNVYVDSQLMDQYQNKLKADHIKATALDFTTLANLKKSITQLGDTFNKTTEAHRLNATLSFKSVKPKTRPKVLLLMGMPGGSFLVGTQHSYVGDLIKRAGGDVIGAGNSPYTTMNVEDIAVAQPTVIIRMAHAMPDSVFTSFDTLFKQAAWQELPAIQENHVYNAEEPVFGMTANINAPQAFKQLTKWLGTN